jgi:uncharacterized integral membrane protein
MADESPSPAEQDERVEETPAAEPERPQRVYRGTGVYGAVVLGIVLATAIVVFVAQNTEGVRIQWIVWEASVALASLVLAAMLLGVVLAVIVGWIWRRRQRRIRSEREELERLRAASR